MMLRSTKSFLNFLFFLFSAGGGLVIFSENRFIPLAALLLPAGLVVVYAVLSGLLLRGCDDRSYAEHQIDSIYFLGFLYTLLSLVTLFYCLYTGGAPAAEEDYIEKTFLFTGISVATSLTGVLFRNIIRSSYLKNHPDSTDELERTYEVLRTMADNFTAGYRETLDSIKLFLAEREETTKNMARQEKRYLKSMEAFIEAAEGFTGTLSRAERELSGDMASFSGIIREHAAGVEEFHRLHSTFADTAVRIRREAEASPIPAINEEMARFEAGTRELNTVLDSLIDVLEVKVEKVG